MSSYTDIPHSKSVEQLFEEFNTSPEGLSSEHAKQRVEQYGPNVLPEGKRTSWLKIYIRQFMNWMELILFPAAIISYLTGQIVDCWVIVAVIFMDTTFGFIQELRAERAIESLKKLIVKTAKVLREGELIVVGSEDVVPGDILILEEGDNIVADGRVIESKNLRTKEASLTGESVPVSKEVEVLAEDTDLAERNNMVWSGTFVAGGYAKILITGTGSNTAMGEISHTLLNIKEGRTSFMKKTDVLARQMSIIAIISAVIIFVTGYFIRQFELNEILLTSIAALVAAIPEGLPAVITIVLAIGANRMSKRNVIVREFTATETLGEVTAILTDKTGTLTQNKLTAKKVFMPHHGEFDVSGDGWFPAGNFEQHGKIVTPDENPSLQRLLRIAIGSNNASIRHNTEEDRYELIGDPTEGALNVLARKGAISVEEFKKIDDLPFSSELKLRATLLDENENDRFLYVTGAPENILDRSNRIQTPSGIIELNPEDESTIQQQISLWSSKALRVIALAYKPYQADTIDQEQLDQLVFAGIVGMIDPPRPDAKEAVVKCMDAGIRVIMVTGDHIDTAVAIARSTGIVPEDHAEKVVALTEKQLLKLDDEEFDKAVREISVFARLTPKMKLRIADRMQKMGHLIAMTGDGVNDAPALKKADVGVSMGIMGTDMARESSDIVLADDNFATIVNAIEEGRIVFTNSRNTSFFLVTTNIAESVTLLATIIMGLPIPLTATQLLWLNLVTDGVTDMALATERGHRGIMKRKPRNQKEPILNKEILPHLFINVIVMSVLTLMAFFYYFDESLEKARTAAFVVMSITQLFNVYNLRDVDQSLFRIGFFSNKWINWGVGVSFLMLVIIVQLPVLASIFKFTPLSVIEFSTLFAISSLVLWSVELYKVTRRNKY